MQFEQFKATLGNAAPPADLPAPLTALWYAGKGNWAQAHNIAQDIPTPDGSWVHAWLHRQEGDQSNAHYWYVKAGRSTPEVSLEDEWESIVKVILASAK